MALQFFDRYRVEQGPFQQFGNVCSASDLCLARVDKGLVEIEEIVSLRLPCPEPRLDRVILGIPVFGYSLVGGTRK